MHLTLEPHADSRAPDIRIDAQAERTAGNGLRLRFRVGGAVDEIVLPPRGPQRRADGLWRHSCFEAFVRAPGEAGYFEINLAPSGEWAAYRFSDYRMGMAEAEEVPPPAIDATAKTESFELTATVELDAALGLLAAMPWQVGLSAVIEAKDGGLSHWALAHPEGQPDFHHRDCFALELPPPERG